MHLTKCLNFTGKHLNSSALVVLHQKQCLSWELPLLNQQGMLTSQSLQPRWLPYQSSLFYPLSKTFTLWSCWPIIVKSAINISLFNVLACPLSVSVWVIGRKQKGAGKRGKKTQTEHLLFSREVIISIRFLRAKPCKSLSSTLKYRQVTKLLCILKIWPSIWNVLMETFFSLKNNRNCFVVSKNAYCFLKSGLYWFAASGKRSPESIKTVIYSYLHVLSFPLFCNWSKKQYFMMLICSLRNMDCLNF